MRLILGEIVSAKLSNFGSLTTQAPTL